MENVYQRRDKSASFRCLSVTLDILFKNDWATSTKYEMFDRRVIDRKSDKQRREPYYSSFVLAVCVDQKSQ